jgi:hypothetical protein
VSLPLDLTRGTRRHQDDRNRRALPPRMTGNRDAVDSGHVQIGHDHIGDLGIYESDRIRP